MIKFCSEELNDFILWINQHYPSETDVRVYEIDSLDTCEIESVDDNGFIVLNEGCMFKNGLGLYLDGCEEIYIVSPSLAKSLLGIHQEENTMTGFKGFEHYTVNEYMLETFAHEYYHHLQHCENREIDEREAEEWCKEIFFEYKEKM